MSDLRICVHRRDFPAAIPHGFYLPEDAPVLLAGNIGVLSRARTTILNSRQSPQMDRSSPWIRGTLSLFRKFDPQTIALVTSTGLITWDFLTWAGGKAGCDIVLVFPAGSGQNFSVQLTKTILDLGLDAKRTVGLRPLRIQSLKDPACNQALRDRWILSLSHRIVPVCVRAGGNFQSYLSDLRLPSQAVESAYRIPYQPPVERKKPPLPVEIKLPGWFHPDRYLIHWTRSCRGPFPEERTADYFERILQSDSNEGGFFTLKRILYERKIRASNRLVRGGYPVVPFTERRPEELPDLIRWRRGLRRWTYEPYGIALRRGKLIELGARPVQYADLADYEHFKEEDRWLFQVAKTRDDDWRTEREWRIPGDVNLDPFSGDEIIALVKSRGEIAQIEAAFKIRAVSLSS
jgi:hypothetical protein